MITTANRLGNVEEYYFSKKLRQIAELNAQGHDILNLGIGSPDRMPAQSVVAKLGAEALKDNVHGYQSYKGIPQLRNAFAGWYAKYFNVTLNPETEILPLIGSKEGIFHISMTYLNSGDEVLVPNPGYPSYGATAELAGATIRAYDLEESRNWQPDLETLAKTDLSKVKIMWVNYPNMPTGAQVDPEFFTKLIAFARAHDILICNDNPYAFILNEQPRSLLAAGLSDHVIELNSLSKSHNMAGWRMGMVAATKAHIDNILRFKSNLDSGMFLPTQLAAVEALAQGDDWYASVNEEYKERRKIAAEVLRTLGCAFDEKQVGMFLWAKIPDSIKEVEPWVDNIMLHAKVFLTPGFIFGSNGQRFIRISLCSKQETFKEALQRINNFLKA
jgi:LL-diaminopimelate aminotransferase